ncbi:cold shock domain-containing protein [Kitasatospora xanthocidica]|uniref:cold-shock protein n=1 Tax=Kitasatospora xanthocidica TaxID=83382 RepID=UPI00286ED6D0|nr:cold shock domain-containing protein [Kitasatospora xanthocidica]
MTAVVCVPLLALAALLALCAPAQAAPTRATPTRATPGQATAGRAVSGPVAAEGRRALLNFGTVKWYNEQKGYGFITPDIPGPDLFVHYSSIVGDGFLTLTEGERVEFQIEQGPKGPQAVDVIPL